MASDIDQCGEPDLDPTSNTPAGIYIYLDTCRATSYAYHKAILVHTYVVHPIRPTQAAGVSPEQKIPPAHDGRGAKDLAGVYNTAETGSYVVPHRTRSVTPGSLCGAGCVQVSPFRIGLRTVESSRVRVEAEMHGMYTTQVTTSSLPRWSGTVLSSGKFRERGPAYYFVRRFRRSFYARNKVATS
jgi:hypothetical protein